MEVAVPPVVVVGEQQHPHLQGPSKAFCGDVISHLTLLPNAVVSASKAGEGCRMDSGSRYEAVPPSENNSMPSNFTIRGFVSLVRKQDIRKTWPFSEELLQRYLSEGKSLPHLDAPLGGDAGGAVADHCEESGGVSAGQRQELELQFHFEEGAGGATRDAKKTHLEESAGDDSVVPDQKGVEAQEDLEHRATGGEQDTASYAEDIPNMKASGAVASSKEVVLVGEEGTAAAQGMDKGQDCIEDKASDTGNEKAEETEAFQGSKVLLADHVGGLETAISIKVTGVDVGLSNGEEGEKLEGQQQNVCPVCASFSCHSVTALNAHMDGCLSSSPVDKSQKLRSKGSKVQKMRSITDIIAADPAPSPKQSDAKQTEAPVVRERRAPNHVVVLADKEAVSKSSSGQPQRHLRSRSRGSRSMIPSPKPDAAEERSTRRRRRECAGNCNQQQKSGEWSEQKKKRHCSGNSVEVTSSWTPSISSGTYCHSKAQDIHVEKPCTEEKPSESHGSANCIDASNVQPVHDAEIADQSSKEKDLEKPEKSGEKSTCTAIVQVTDDSSSNKADTEKQAQEVLPRPDNVPEAVPFQVAAEAQVLETEIGIEDKDESAPPVSGCDHPKEEVSAVVEVVDTTPPRAVEGVVPASVNSIPAGQACTTGAPSEASVPGSAVLTEATATTTKQGGEVYQRPKPAIPLYDSMISSLRSSTAVDSLTGYSHFNPTWKAAVVMATLGASLIKTTGTSTASTTVTTVGNKNEASAPRGVTCTQASESTSVSVIPAVETAQKTGTAPIHRDSHTGGIAAEYSHPKAAVDRSAFNESNLHGYQHLQFPALPTQIGHGSRIASSGSDRSRYSFQTLNHGENVQIFPSGNCHQRAQQIPKVPVWMHAGDRPTVIDLDQDTPKAQATTADGKGEKPVLRLLGQNVMVESTTASTLKDGHGSKNPYGFSVPAVPSVHSGGHAYHTPCCCGSRSTPAEHITFALGNGNMSNNSSIPQIPLAGTWRLLPNGMISQVNGQQLNLQTGGSGKLGNAHAHHGNGCCLLKNCSHVTQQPGRQSGEQEASGRSIKHSGDLPPWLLAAKKQKEAEFAANVIVIDDDEPEDHKVTTKSVSSVPPRAGSSNADIQFTGERNARAQHADGNNASARHISASGSSQLSGRKREAGAEWSLNCHQQAEKAAKVTAVDSPVGNRMGIPVLVPTWMITSNTSAAPANTTKRGATAQTYKARIAMMKAFMHGNDPTAAAVINPAQIQQQRGLMASAVQPSYIYQVPTQQGTRVFQLQGGGDCGANPSIITHPSMYSQQQQQQQFNSLVFGKDCHIIELDDGQCLLVNGHMMEAATIAANGPAEHQMLAAAAADQRFRDASGRNFIICNNETLADHHRRAGVAGTSEQPILVAPMIQHQSGIVLAAEAAAAHHHHHHQAAAVVPLSLMQQQQQQQSQQLNMLQKHKIQADKGVICSWGYGQKSGPQ